MLDRFLIGQVERISPEAPVPVVLIEQEKETLGGAGNVAHNVRCLGHQSILVSVCGQDAAAAQVSHLVERLGIQAQLVSDPDRKTTVKSRIVDSSRHQVLHFDQESKHPVSGIVAEELEAKLRTLVPQARAVLISDYTKGCVTDHLARLLVDQADGQGIPIIVDSKRIDLRIFRDATIITPNLKEASLALGGAPLGSSDEEAAQAADRLRQETGVLQVLLTRGERGMTLATPETILHLKALARQVFDVTGAGDTVAAMLSVSLAEGHPLPEAVRRANLAASLAVGKAGTEPVYRDEFDRASNSTLLSTKIQTWEQARQTVQARKARGQTIVFTNGCFDILHAGHLYCLEEARRQGDYLVVALNSDRSVRGLKGSSRPIVPEHHRAQLLAALECVDLVVLFDEPDPARLVELLRPSVMVKGGDYRPEEIAGAARVLADGGRIVIVPIFKGLSTTQIVRQVSSLAHREQEKSSTSGGTAT